MWPFRKKPLLESQTQDWHLENFLWLTKIRAAQKGLTKSVLALPTTDFYPSHGLKGHERARDLFERTAQFAQIDADIFNLEDLGGPPREDFTTPFPIQHGKHAVGLYSTQDHNRPTISYSFELLSQPSSLIATFAHEFGHFIIDCAPEDPVCENDEMEFLTDLAAIYMGFGVFTANNVFEFSQSNAGWSYSRTGYLPEDDCVFGLAIFIAVKNIDPVHAKSSLKPHLAKKLDHALRDLSDRKHDLAVIAALEDAPAPALV